MPLTQSNTQSRPGCDFLPRRATRKAYKSTTNLGNSRTLTAIALLLRGGVEVDTGQDSPEGERDERMALRSGAGDQSAHMVQRCRTRAT